MLTCPESRGTVLEVLDFRKNVQETILRKKGGAQLNGAMGPKESTSH